MFSNICVIQFWIVWAINFKFFFKLTLSKLPVMFVIMFKRKIINLNKNIGVFSKIFLFWDCRVLLWIIIIFKTHILISRQLEASGITHTPYVVFLHDIPFAFFICINPITGAPKCPSVNFIRESQNIMLRVASTKAHVKWLAELTKTMPFGTVGHKNTGVIGWVCHLNNTLSVSR